MLRPVSLMLVLAGLTLVLACGAPSAVGRWQVADNPNAGLEIRQDGTFSGELGSGSPRVRVEGTWKANGNAVAFTLGGPLGAITQGALGLNGQINGSTMVVTAVAPIPNLTGSFTLQKR